MESTPEKDWTSLDARRVVNGLDIQSSRTPARLNQINRVRAFGIGDYITLPFLRDILDRHIERELPKVKEDVRLLLIKTNQELVDLGMERSSPVQIRIYLTRISTKFDQLVKGGVEGVCCGHYNVFQADNEDYSVRFQAAVHKEYEHFAKYIRKYGEKRKIVSTSQLDQKGTREGQILVTEEEMSTWVKKMYRKTKEREVWGNYNDAMLTELFHAQSVHWGDIARKHIRAIADLVSKFIHFSLTFAIKDVDVRQNVNLFITRILDKRYDNALQELDKLLQDEAGHALRNSGRNTIHDNFGNTVHRVIVDMTEQSCLDARSSLNAYYKAALKTFIDNAYRQVVERHILTNLADVFNPVTVSSYTDDELVYLAGESAQINRRRNEARQLKKALEQSLRDLAN